MFVTYYHFATIPSTVSNVYNQRIILFAMAKYCCLTHLTRGAALDTNRATCYSTDTGIFGERQDCHINHSQLHYKCVILSVFHNEVCLSSQVYPFSYILRQCLSPLIYTLGGKSRRLMTITSPQCNELHVADDSSSVYFAAFRSLSTMFLGHRFWAVR